ncbi:MAG: type VI secretion system-associated FHA domain protein TagH, partial [Thiohalomonadales bacterium]
MSLTIQVVSFPNQSQPPSDLSITINGTDCSIGRSKDNDLVLPDPERIISHCHAVINFRDNAYFLSDKSTNGTTLNHAAEPMGPLPIPLNDGDSIKMGNYDCRISLQPIESAPPKSALLSARQSPPVDDNIDSWRPPVHTHSAPVAPNNRPSQDNPSGSQTAQLPNGLESLLSKSESLRDDIIPKDFDFLNPPNSIVTESQGQDFEHGSIENQFFCPPEPLPAPEPNESISTVNTQQSELERRADRITKKTATTANSTTTISPTAADKNVQHKDIADNKTSNKNNKTKQSNSSYSEEEQKLLYAFLVGAELTQIEIPPEAISTFMHNSGTLLRELVKGIKQTLDTRTDIKGEFRLDMTILRPLQNNPLKFSIDVDDALTKLIQPPKGYLPPVEAVQEATDDLQAHQMATLEGLRAALNSLIGQFNPDVLEKNFKSTSLADNLLPAVRKAKYWELFKTQYHK